jgi:aspartyl-tRNA(Asn)/glutamyl-tRNA(Gln) amidotransferase subunit C
VWGARTADSILALVSERLTRDDVVKVAFLARLHLTDTEIDRATSQLDDMLGHFADIDALDLDGVEPMTQAFPLVNVLRDDIVEPGIDRDEALSQAPATEDGRFVVPPTGGER